MREGAQQLLRAALEAEVADFVDRHRGAVLRRSARRLRESDPDLGSEEAMQSAKNLAMIELGMDDVCASRGQPMKQTLREIADEFGVKLSR